MHIPLARATLEQLFIEHEHLDDLEVAHLRSAIAGWHVVPRMPAARTPIPATVWLACALSTGGRYHPPEIPGQPADLRDGGPPVDSVILMAVIQRHFLPAPQPAWDDDALGAQLGLEPRDVSRAQRALDAIYGLVPRGRPPLGPRWWTRAPRGRLPIG